MSVTASQGEDRLGEHGEDGTSPALKPLAVAAGPEVPGWGEADGGAESSARAHRPGSGRLLDAEATSTVVSKERVVIDVDIWPTKLAGSSAACDRQSSDRSVAACGRQPSFASIASSAKSAKLLCGLRLGRWASGFVASLVVAVTVALCILVSMSIPPGTHDGLISILTAPYFHYGVLTIISAIAVTTMLILGSSPHFRIVAACIFFVWLQMSSSFAAHGLHAFYNSSHAFVINLCSVSYTLSWVIADVLGCVGVKLRIDALQTASAECQRHMRRRVSCSTISLRVLVVSTLLNWVCVGALFYYMGSPGIGVHVDVLQLLYLVTLGIVGCSYWTFASTSCHVFFRAWRVAAGVAAVAKERLKDDARQAQRTALFQLLGTWMSFTTTFLSVGLVIAQEVLSLQQHIPFLNDLVKWEHAVACVDALANILLALALAGVFSGSLVGSFVKGRLEFERRCLHRSTTATTTLSENPEWNSTLEQLASRGFTLQALLEFYKGLGKDYMPHYDSERHTTLDVVRQAIIPLSSDRCVAYASIMMRGEPTRPETMVTHGWGNLFRNLISAIISDALGESEYAMVAYLIDHDIESLERWIHAMGKQSSTYWVCAFSVNQHATICGVNYGDCRDPVTGELHPTCCCSHKKILNETPPCFNGKSIHCEVNKFDDFMALMASSSQSFQQVVAVDASFTLFSRAWCVAELAVAAKMGMRQKVKVHSRQSLDLYSDQLRTLRIEEMHASREEDKAEILSKIPDKEKFNKELRSLLMERLFPSWHSLDPTDQMIRMSSLKRWHSVSKTKSLDYIWEACSSHTLDSP